MSVTTTLYREKCKKGNDRLHQHVQDLSIQRFDATNLPMCKRRMTMLRRHWKGATTVENNIVCFLSNLKS